MHTHPLRHGEGEFQSTLPTRGATIGVYIGGNMVIISIHAPHEGERRYNQNESVAVGVGFQSTLPTRGSDQMPILKGNLANISIHAPHEGERRQMV